MIAADTFMIVFRSFHILAGVLWVGSAFLFVGFIGPSVAEVGPSAGPLLTAVVKKRKVAKVITVLGAVTVVAGWILWLKNMSSYPSLGDWVTSSFGLVLTIGGVLATISAFVGAIGVGRNVERARRPGRRDRCLGGSADAGATVSDGSAREGVGAPREDRPRPAGPRRPRDGDRALLVGARRSD